MKRWALLILFLPTLHADPPPPAVSEARLLSDTRQLTFAGRRSGEGYFTADGRAMCYQAEREPGNPFYQIYRLDLASGASRRVSPGHGKTTCAWPAADGRHVLFASTHLDPQAKGKQRAELVRRRKGERKRYSWDYDEHYDIFLRDLATGELKRITSAKGYDAECALSPDGKRVVFSSNRHAYAPGVKMSEKEAKTWAVDKASQLDIYVMNVDGSGLKRLTSSFGYDGGPFFSPDGTRICWRRFDASGAKAEVLTMKADGTDVRQLTKLGAMSWAPFWHPSGEYLIFATNRHGFANFELYLVDAAGKREPVRVTYTPGFDGLPAFSPDGARMAWTSTRTNDKKAHLFVAKWNHRAARGMLGYKHAGPAIDMIDRGGRATARRAIAATDWRCRGADVWRHVRDLTTPAMAGRLTGTDGEARATAYVAEAFARLGLAPGNGDSYFEGFSFTAGIALGNANGLTMRRGGTGSAFIGNSDWLPLAFSASGTVKDAPLVFCGYGIEAPAGEKQSGYSSYGSADVKGKWCVVLRYLPEKVAPGRRQYLERYASLRHKAMIARDRGAVGLLVVSGPNARVKQQVVPLTTDATLASTSIAVVSIRDAAAARLLEGSGKTLAALQTTLDQGKMLAPLALPKGTTLSARIALQRTKRHGRNVLGRLRGSDPKAAPVLIGAHVDHLGAGDHGSRARKGEKGHVHHGADDNASGVAAVLEAAAYLAHLKASGAIAPRRDILFVAWSGEELGLIGSTHHAQTLLGAPGKAKRKLAAVLNMDMVGRYRETMQLQGTGSSPVWPALIESANAPVGLRLRLASPAYLPTDSTPFYLRGIPVLNAFSGTHDDYHTPRDTLDRLNVDGAALVAKLMARIAVALASSEALPPHVAQAQPRRGGGRARSRVFLGTIPDYAGAGKGVKLSGVVKGGPAEKGGLRAGDIVIELAGRKVETIYDFAYALRALRVGKTTKVVVIRAGKQVVVDVTPVSRD